MNTHGFDCISIRDSGLRVHGTKSLICLSTVTSRNVNISNFAELFRMVVLNKGASKGLNDFTNTSIKIS